MPTTAKSALIGSRIRSRRRELHMSQAMLAKTAGLSVRTLVRYEGGNVSIPRATFISLAQALVIEPEKLDPEYLGKAVAP